MNNTFSFPSNTMSNGFVFPSTPGSMILHGDAGANISQSTPLQSSPVQNLQFSSDNSQFDATLPPLVLNPLFIDNLAKEFGLTAAQRAQLHVAAQVCLMPIQHTLELIHDLSSGLWVKGS